MNVKKQLNKIIDHVEELETLSDKEHEELEQYKFSAYKFVKMENTVQESYEEFKTLLGDTIFIGGDLMATYDGILWRPIIDTDLKEEEHPYAIWYRTYRDENVKLREENAKLREQLRWHPVSEQPKTKFDRLWSVDVLLKNDYESEPILAYYSIRSKCWYDYFKADLVKLNDKSRWCYIPEYEEQ